MRGGGGGGGGRDLHHSALGSGSLPAGTRHGTEGLCHQSKAHRTVRRRVKGDGDIVVDAIVDQVCNKHTDCERWITLIYDVGF